MHNRLSWGCTSVLNTKFIIVYICYTCSLYKIFYIFSNFVHKIRFHGMGFSTWGMMSEPRKFQILECIRFQIFFGLGMLYLE